jgi:hypothetical protein
VFWRPPLPVSAIDCSRKFDVPLHSCVVDYLREFARKRIINSDTVAQFKVKLSHENWSDTFAGENIDISFQGFLNIYLRIFYHCFPYKNVHNNYSKKAWITKGIKISCQWKRDLYKLCKTSHDSNLKYYYKNYTKILADVIKTTKRKHYNKLYSCSKNKVKTMWNLIRSETNKQT